MLFRKQKPLDYTSITKNVLLGITPKPTDYKLLSDLGVKLVINMRAERTPLQRPLIPIIWIPTFDSRFFPIQSSKLLKAVARSLAVINKGGKVYVYCHRGRHRSVVMVGAILIAQGQNVESALSLIKKRRDVADPEARHIRAAIVRFADLWEGKRV